VALSLLLGGCQNQPTAEEIVARMQEVEASIEDAHAVVEFRVQAQGMDAELAVEMWEESPNKFRAEVLEASEDNLVGMVSVTDGQQVWIYNPAEGEALVGRVGEFGVDEPFNAHQVIEGMEEAIQRVLETSDFELMGEEDVGGAATYKLHFTPRDGEELALPIPVEGQGTLWVEQERWIVLQAHFDGGAAGEGWVRVRSFEFNTGVPDDRFRFEIPADVRVIDVEEVQPTPLTLDEARDQAGFPLLVPDYVPDGATLIDVFTVSGAFVLRYDHSLVSFTVTQRLAGEEPSEQRSFQGAEEIEVSVRGQAGALVSDGVENSLLTWTENGVEVTIAGRISQDEVLKIAESLQ
jgi:outer membrane lipoprotein-sorting protein